MCRWDLVKIRLFQRKSPSPEIESPPVHTSPPVHVNWGLGENPTFPTFDEESPPVPSPPEVPQSMLFDYLWLPLATSGYANAITNHAQGVNTSWLSDGGEGWVLRGKFDRYAS